VYKFLQTYKIEILVSFFKKISEINIDD
jgi:hypothetical protein